MGLLHNRVRFQEIANNLRSSGCFVLAEHVQIFFETDTQYLALQLFEKELSVIWYLHLNFFVFSSDPESFAVFNLFLAESHQRLMVLSESFDIDFGAVRGEKRLNFDYLLQPGAGYAGTCLFLRSLLSSLGEAYAAAAPKDGATNSIKVNLDAINQFALQMGATNAFS